MTFIQEMSYLFKQPYNKTTLNIKTKFLNQFHINPSKKPRSPYLCHL